MRNIDIQNYSSGKLGRNYAGTPHCDLCGYEPKQQANYGLMLADLRVHRQNVHGQKRMKHMRRTREASSEPDVSMNW